MKNSIRLKTVRELTGLRFYIPSYQRGYRWKKTQVNDLLNDIMEFTSRDDDQAADFYCLQPLVVKETVPDIKGFLNDLPHEATNDTLADVRSAIHANTRWEVIDGQQRLTTIYLIQAYLSGVDMGLYSIDYQTRGCQNTPIHSIANGNEQDRYFMESAYDTITDWFEDHSSIDRSSFLDSLLDKVQFIWYETEEKPTQVFKRLNIGKIGLTNAELIKALFLNRANYGESDYNKILIASQWDSFESTLQNDEFWIFLHETGYDKPTRMEYIFGLICDMGLLDDLISWKKNEKATVIGTDKYKTFRYFNAFLKSENAQKKANEEGLTVIALCWNEVKALFRIFEEWYSDLELYHYVGYYLTCNSSSSITELLKSWSEKYSVNKNHEFCKSAFKEDLIEKIKATISNCKDLEKQYELDNNDKKTECRPLLLLHNIQTVIDQNKGFIQREDYKLGVFYKFPFHLYKRETWNVEHIDSNTTNTLDDYTEQRKWLLASWYFLPEKETALRDKIADFIRKEGKDMDFDRLHEEILGHFRKEGSLTSQEKNQIWNFVLLDEHTNKSYGNSIFPMKKMVISGKDHCIEYSLEPKDDGISFTVEQLQKSGEQASFKTAFVPPVTKSAFMKEFNPLSANPYSWDRKDAEEYKKNIQETLKLFLK